jgi:hypothetical protein
MCFGISNENFHSAIFRDVPIGAMRMVQAEWAKALL